MSGPTRMTRLSRRLAAAAIVAGLSCAMTPATAVAQGASVLVNVNMARILRINSPASTVIIGNPGIADVTIQDPQTLVLTGKTYGQTNLIILDEIGNPIADTMVEVVQQQAEIMTVYMGDARTTLKCNPNCQPTVMLGDDPGFTSETIASSNLISAAAAE